MMDLPVPDAAWGAVVALYSIIHLPAADHGAAVTELARTLAPGALLLLSFHVGDGVIHRDEMLGQQVQLDFHLPTSRHAIAICEEAGLTVQVNLERQPYLAVEAPTTRGYVLAQKLTQLSHS
jgi:SAM-dependent methyltransferase